MEGMLSIHILGQGYGESIILCLPNGGVGVVDCYSRRLKADDSTERLGANPTLRFLRNTLHTERLAFLGFTHPHEDHGRGLSHILTEYRDRIDAIWIFDAFQNIALERYLSALFNGKRRLPIESLLDEDPGTFSAELLRIRNLVLKQANVSNPTRAKARTFKGSYAQEIAGESVRVRFLGPSVALAMKYEADLVDNLADVVDEEGDVIDESWKPDRVNHNLASPSLLIEYGQTRLVLGGDMEIAGWTEALGENAGHDFAVQLVKVSHHGSETGIADGLYERLGANAPPLAVLTPFTRHKHPLPRRAAVDRLKQHTRELWTTNLKAARRALEIESPLSSEEITWALPVLEKWKQDVDENPSLWGAFDPRFVQQQGRADVPESLSSIPEAWSEDLVRQPRLAVLLHPGLRSVSLPRSITEEPTEEAHRLSFSFRDDGTEIVENRYVGTECGQLE